jgi:hypothetical protein
MLQPRLTVTRKRKELETYIRLWFCIFIKIDKYDRAIYLSRFFMALIILCLLAVEREHLGPFSLLGLEVGCCLLQGKHFVTGVLLTTCLYNHSTYCYPLNALAGHVGSIILGFMEIIVVHPSTSHLPAP